MYSVTRWAGSSDGAASLGSCFPGTPLRPYIAAKQKNAVRFASSFAPKTRWGLFLRNQTIKAFSIPGLARFAIGRDIIDALELPDYALADQVST